MCEGDAWFCAVTSHIVWFVLYTLSHLLTLGLKPKCYAWYSVCMGRNLGLIYVCSLLLDTLKYLHINERGLWSGERSMTVFVQERQRTRESVWHMWQGASYLAHYGVQLNVLAIVSLLGSLVTFLVFRCKDTEREGALLWSFHWDLASPICCQTWKLGVVHGHVDTFLDDFFL